MISDIGSTGFIPSGRVASRNDEVTIDESTGGYLVNGEELYYAGQEIEVTLLEANAERRSLIFAPAEKEAVESIPF